MEKNRDSNCDLHRYCCFDISGVDIFYYVNWHGNLYPKLSISMGYVCASEDPTMQIKDMMREADKRMYARKSEYYMKEGNDRRRK